MLKGALGKLIGGGGGAGDDTSFNLATPYGRLQAFFYEIDQTTAARRLTLAIGDAQVIFDVQNKKVLRLIELTPDTDGRGAIASRIERDYNQLDGQLKLLAEILTTFVSRAGEFDMVSRPSPVTYPPKTDGFPAAEWRFACDMFGVVPAAVVPEVARGPGAAPAPAAPSGGASAAPSAREPAMAAAAQAAAGQAAQPAAVMASVASALAAAPAAAAAVATAPMVDTAVVERFYGAVAKHCDLAMMIDEDGAVLEFTDDAAGWFDLGGEIAKDMKAWVEETAHLMPGSQLVMMRSPILQNQSVIFMTNGKKTAFGAFSSHVTGRIFSLANEYVGHRK
ncbi:hypothetical protein [Neogemmobacter tilapiae]|uniref:Uncharacterized protein n=1 Tax=Neogemmobacter tilapiae TaxID=875041 RepID=A0A918WH90_9RHOB|nr:hypothetical protein [Gemmobacter tilapiae]GHC47393.1 hypothetical protein GCM10007315_06480 [Gemmobacter tilapiae]